MEIKITQAAKDYRAKMFAGVPSTLAETDPEFAAIYENFAFDKVPNSSDLDDRTRFVSVISALSGCQSVAVCPMILRCGTARTTSSIRRRYVFAVAWCASSTTRYASSCPESHSVT